GTASHQVHQGRASLPVPAHGRSDLPAEGSSGRNLSHRPQYHVLSPNTKLPLRAALLHAGRRRPRGVPGRLFRVALSLSCDTEATPAPGARVCAHGRHGPLLSR
ncbi:unnamed protein product, partial [Gulo gulo]